MLGISSRLLLARLRLSCGSTCLHAVHGYYGDRTSLGRVIRETPRLDGAGTLAVYMALRALRRGQAATIYTYNLQVFDPTWFHPAEPDLRERLAARASNSPSGRGPECGVRQ